MKQYTTISIATALLAGSAIAAIEDFSSAKLNASGGVSTKVGEFKAQNEDVAVHKSSADDTPGSLHIVGGEGREVELILAKELQDKKLLALRFNGERWTRSGPFTFRIEGKADGKWKPVYNGDKLPLRALKKSITVDLKGQEFEAFRFKATTKEGSGVLLDNISVVADGPMIVQSVKVKSPQIPMLIRKDDAIISKLVVSAEGSKKADSVKNIYLSAKGSTDLKDVESFSLYALAAGSNDLSKAKKLATCRPNAKMVYSVNHSLVNGENVFAVQANVKAGASLAHRVTADIVSVKFSKKGLVKLSKDEPTSKRIGYSIATSGDKVVRTDGSMKVCRRMRIPGMVTTNAGSLLAVYDLRWSQDGDLPGDIDIGLSRSTNGGRSWEAPRPVVDMGEWLGESESKNGVGDPAILVDKKTGHIYISGLVSHGLNRGWYWGLSKPGLAPKDTGQVVISKSEDDGKTWSTPKNITPEIKDPAWQLMLQGPGAGISMRDGTLVFAFQYKANIGTQDEPKYSARSSIMYSKDHGKSWKVAPGVDYPQETTEAQVVELNDGSLMLNCRISAGGRAVFTTKNFGETWTQHKTSGRGTFNMTGCMSSILRYSSTKDGDEKDILLFSGPADGGKARRSHQSVRYSLDEGETWSTPYLLDELAGGGYSCLTLIEEDGRRDIGIIYEGSQSNMAFERLTLEELMNK